MAGRRALPNILITGTPGTGKSTLSSELCEKTSLEWLNVGEIVKDNQLYEEYDPNFDCYVLDEDGLVCEIEDKMSEGGKVVDYHSCEFFPEKWFDIVFVLSTDNTILYDRLVRRGYNEKKLKNNIECEIFHTILDEARAAYDSNIVFPLNSNTPDDMENNVEQICLWIEEFKKRNSKG